MSDPSAASPAELLIERRGPVLWLTIAREERRNAISHAVVAAQQIRTWRVAIEPATMSAERFASRLRQAAPPVVAKLEADRVVLDLRSVFPRQDPQLAAAVSSLTEARGAAMASQPAE